MLRIFILFLNSLFYLKLARGTIFFDLSIDMSLWILPINIFQFLLGDPIKEVSTGVLKAGILSLQQVLVLPHFLGLCAKHLQDTLIRYPNHINWHAWKQMKGKSTLSSLWRFKLVTPSLSPSIANDKWTGSQKSLFYSTWALKVCYACLNNPVTRSFRWAFCFCFYI